MKIIKTIIIIMIILGILSLIGYIVHKDYLNWSDAEDYCEKEMRGEFKAINIVSDYKCLIERESKLHLYKMVKFRDNWRLAE